MDEPTGRLNTEALSTAIFTTHGTRRQNTCITTVQSTGNKSRPKCPVNQFSLLRLQTNYAKSAISQERDIVDPQNPIIRSDFRTHPVSSLNGGVARIRGLLGFSASGSSSYLGSDECHACTSVLLHNSPVALGLLKNQAQEILAHHSFA